MKGNLVLACRSAVGEWESGGYDEAGAEEMGPLLAEFGIELVRVFDGEAEAREKFPPGTRVLAARKHWGSPLGVVTGSGYAVNGSGATVVAEFDGHASVWPASSA